MFDGIGKLVSGDYEIRGGTFGKVMVCFAVCAMIFPFASLAGIMFYYDVIHKQDPIVESIAFDLERQRQLPMVIELLECENPVAKGDSSHISWSCTGNTGTYNHHTYEYLPDGTQVAFYVKDFNYKGKATWKP